MVLATSRETQGKELPLGAFFSSLKPGLSISLPFSAPPSGPIFEHFLKLKVGNNYTNVCIGGKPIHNRGTAMNRQNNEAWKFLKKK